MKTLQELSAELRAQYARGPNYAPSGIEVVDQLDAWIAENMPPWVEITEDDDSWPDYGQAFYLAPTNGGHPATYQVWTCKDGMTTSLSTDGRWSWRPLNAYDTPQGE
jgi:hypothetical protein